MGVWSFIRAIFGCGNKEGSRNLQNVSGNVQITRNVATSPKAENARQKVPPNDITHEERSSSEIESSSGKTSSSVPVSQSVPRRKGKAPSPNSKVPNEPQDRDGTMGVAKMNENGGPEKLHSNKDQIMPSNFTHDQGTTDLPINSSSGSIRDYSAFPPQPVGITDAEELNKSKKLNRAESNDNEQPINLSDKKMEILDLHDRFKNVDLATTKIPQESVEFMEMVERKASSFETGVKEYSGTNYSIEYFLLDENLMRLLDLLDKIKCRDNQPVLQAKIKVIKYIKELQTTLDNRATE